MATKKRVSGATAKKTADSNLPKVSDYTILINCMKPCTPCDALAKKAITRAFKAWAAEAGYTVVYSDDNSKVTGYWKRYGKPNKVLQATPQVYVVGAKQKCSGVCIREGETVGDYTIPSYDQWDAKMLREICEQLGA